MDRKTFTVLVTSNRRGGTFRWVFPAAWLKAAALLAGVILLVGVAASVDYGSLLLREGENKKLKAQNLLLERQLQLVESKVASLEQGLDRVKTFETKLKLITNIDDSDRLLKLSMGPGAPTPTPLSMPSEGDGRYPASESFEEDAQFMDPVPVNTQRGELFEMPTRNYASLSVRIDRAVREVGLVETGVVALYNSLNEKRALINATPNVKPVGGWFTSRFGYRLDPFTGRMTMHKGIDIAASPGTPVIAPADGVVSFVGFDPGYGKLVSIDHGYGVKTRFGHNSQVFVELGQKVRRNDVIAAVGSTGRASGPHLHYEVHVNDLPVDPINYVVFE